MNPREYGQLLQIRRLAEQLTNRPAPPACGPACDHDHEAPRQTAEDRALAEHDRIKSARRAREDHLNGLPPECNHDQCCYLPQGCAGGCTQPGGCATRPPYAPAEPGYAPAEPGPGRDWYRELEDPEF